MPTKASLVLKNGLRFKGFSLGAPLATAGEVVFNTGMVGYPETLTDPSYYGQILVLTYPLIGNYGVPAQIKEKGLPKFFESEKIQVKGLVIANYSENFFHHKARQSLGAWLKSQKIPALYGLDTRFLTQKLRKEGVLLGKICFNNQRTDWYDPNQRNLASEVSIKRPKIYGQGRPKIVVIDCGLKASIIRAFLKRKVNIIRVPWNFDFFRLRFQGLIISNGPGNPEMYQETIANVKKALVKNIPTFGVCLGNQILALAAGAKTYKLKYGHRSQNQPVQIAGSEKCYLTSQNHGYSVNGQTLPRHWQEWFINANDGTNEGIKHQSKPFMSVQFHPEANPGPTDTAFLFDEFINIVSSI